MAIEVGNAYQKTTWNVGMPITQQKMNNIEEGIEALDTLSRNIANSTNEIRNEIDDTATGIKKRLTTCESTASEASNKATAAEQATAAGIFARSQINSILTYNNNPNTPDKTLSETINDRISAAVQAEAQARASAIQSEENARSSADEALSSNLNTVGQTASNAFEKAGTLERAIQAAYSTGYIINDNGQQVPAKTLAEKISYMDSTLSTVQGSAQDAYNAVFNENLVARVTTLDGGQDLTDEPYTMNVPMIISEIKGARGTDKLNNANTSLDARFDLIDGGSAPSRTLPNVITELETARGNGNDNLNARLDKIDAAGSSSNKTHLYRITELETELTTARNGEANLDTRLDALDTTVGGKVAKLDIKKNLTYNVDDDTVLQARQGKLLKDDIDSLDNILNTQNTGLVDRVSAIETEIDMTSANSRIDLVETEINNAHRVEVNDDTLDNRFDDIESAITILNGNASTNGSVLNTVNTQIAAVVNSAPEAFDTLGEIAAWIQNDTSGATAMQQAISNNAGAISALDTRLTAIDNSTNGRMKEAEDDIDALETTVGNASAGLVKRVADTESAIDHAASGNDPGGLTQRITALETAPKSATVIITYDKITYDNQTGNPTIYNSTDKIDANKVTPTENVDYLLQEQLTENNTIVGGKYYYWKYIGIAPNGTWHLISGGTSEGGGNSSASIVAELPDASNADRNTDYYVGNNTNGYVHYRFIPTTVEEIEVLVPVAIANYVDTNEINKYRLQIRDIPVSEGSAETNKWLYLYKFGYGENTDIDTDETFTDPIWATRKVDAIQLPEGGGGGGTYTALKVTRITPRAITAPKDSVENRTYLQFFFTDGEVGETYRYSLSLSGRTVLPSSANTEITSGDPLNKSSTWPTKTQEVDGETITIPMSATEVPIGFYSIDITPYCTTLGPNQPLVLTITSESNQNLTASTTWDLTVIQFNLASSAADGLIVNKEQEVALKYTPTGAIEKVLHVEIGEHKYTQSLQSYATGKEYEFIIPANSETHGAHTIDMYMTAVINGNKTLTTDHIYKQYIWYDPNITESSTIIASPKAETGINVESYTDIQIPYSVYHKESGNYNIYYYLNYGTQSEKLIDSIQANGNYIDTINYTPYTTSSNVENQTITIVVDNITLTINVQVSPIAADVSPVSKPIIDFDPSGLSNNSINRLPSWTVDSTTYSMTTSDNFNWSNDINGGGYKEDEDGKCFVIKAGSYAYLDYPFFQRGLHTESATSTVFDRGAEMKIIFKVSAVRNIDAVWFSNTGTYTDKTVGIQLGAHSGWLKTDKAADSKSAITPDEDGIITINDATYTIWKPNTQYQVDDIRVIRDTIYRCTKAEGTSVDYDLQNEDVDLDEDPYKSYLKLWLKIGQLDTEILATNSYLYMPYSEEDKIELDININKYAATSKNNFIMAYEDGVPSKVYSYNYGAGGDGISHNNTIRIGSPDCDVYIYRLRIYNKSLDTNDILQNFIADGKDIREKLKRYNRNCIYWNQGQGKYYPTTDEDTVLDPVKLAKRIPNVKVLMLDTPVFTTGKKNYIMNSSLRCIHATVPEDYDGNVYYASRGDADNWFFQNGFHAGQGTTSDNYGQSARNVDFLFEVDGQHWPAVEKDIKVTYNKSNYPDYKSYVLIGDDASEWEETEENSGIYHWVEKRQPTADEKCEDWKGDNCKISLTQTSVPNNYFNLKVNVASSENVNNALFQARYNQFINDAYPSPATDAQKIAHANTYANINNIKVKNSMEFVPAILFVRENQVDEQGNPKGHNEFNDCNWHFYALGNIGDSKKTDYTRAYDPDDMNEFTCENSDNNTNNGQFQSGVFTYQSHRAIETPYKAYDSNKTYSDGDIVVDNGVIKIYDGTNWSNATLTGWTDESIPYFAPFTAPNTMEYIYPISPSEWNVKIGDNWVNYKHYTLVKEKFDGDHSFEFRYACKGDYRDGKLINDTNGLSDVKADPEDPNSDYLTKDSVQEKLNHDVMLAFYEWLVTADPTQYVNEASLWFVKPAMEFFYAYTHYYTMMDNRAKNTFWHFAKTGTYIEVSRPVKALLHVYEESTDNGQTWTKATGTEIDLNKKYRTQYAFDLWAYDMDTAAGIDNNGALVFPYGKEDTDYRTEGDAASGYAFNGAGSIFWRRLSTTFESEIVDIMKSADASCFNSQDLIDQFDRFQECFPEEIWRLDIERKYIRTFTGLSIDNSITKGKQNPRFLTSMMQGRKKYQRRQWIRDQGIYFNSKYRLNDIIASENTIEFNCTTPAIPEWAAGTSYTVGQKVFYAPEPAEGETINRQVYRCIQANSDTTFNDNKWVTDVTPTYHLSLTPYQDMYLNVQVGNGNYQSSYVTTGKPTLRAKAGQEYIFDITGNYQETRIYINGANHLSGIGNLAPMYPYSFDLRALAHIKVLDIGTDDTGYVNTKFTELKLPDYVPLLETLNIKNCHSVAGTIELSEANNIRVIEAAGTAISGISLPDYTNIETLHVPSTMTALNLYGARFLTDFKVINNSGVIDYGALYKLHIYDSDYSSNINWLDIAKDIIVKENLDTELSLLKLSTSSIANIQELRSLSLFRDSLLSVNSDIELSGNITITGNWSTIEAKQYTNNVGYYNENNIWTSALTPEEIAANLNPIWPEVRLIVDQSKRKNKCEVKYYHGGYTRNGTYIEPVYITTEYVDEETGIVPDIYQGKSNSELPTRAPTIDKVFSFGAYTEEGYIPYSGWSTSTENNAVSLYDQGYNIDTSPYNPRIGLKTLNLYTYYYETPHQYTVKWMMSGIEVKSVTRQSYGGGYELIAPTVADIRKLNIPTTTFTINNDGTCTYQVFKGWNRLPTNITPNEDEALSSTYIINAEWDTYSNKTFDDNDSTNGIFNDISNVSAEQLLILSRISQNEINNHNNTKAIVQNTKFNYQMGYQGAIPGTSLIRNSGTNINVKRVTANTAPQYVTVNNEGIYPFTNNDGFTLVIDYQFGPQNSTNLPEILVGCYEKSSGNAITGFALFRNGSNAYISYGIYPKSDDTSKRRAIGDTTHRNIVVLRHPKNSAKLYIYSSQSPMATTSLNQEIYKPEVIDLTTQNLSSTAGICIGHLRTDIINSTDTTYEDERNNTRKAQGTVYWMKYWDEDLGEGECMQLASWPHENMTAIITAVNGEQTNAALTKPKLYLTNLTCPHALMVTDSNFQVANANSQGSYSNGWLNSNAKALCDGRIFNGLPINLQSIVSNPRIGYYDYRSYVDDYGSVRVAVTNDSIKTVGNSMVYIPSISSLNSGYSAYDKESIYELTGNTENLTSAITPYVWFSSVDDYIIAQNYVGGEQHWALIEHPLQQWLNIRFREKPISWSTQTKLRIYTIERTNNFNDTFYDAIGAENIRANDIVIYTNDGTLVGVYMYVSASELSTYGIQIKPQEGVWKTGASNAVDGGWIESTAYVTRSVTSNEGKYPNFIYITKSGSTISPSYSEDSAASGSLSLDFAFTI